MAVKARAAAPEVKVTWMDGVLGVAWTGRVSGNEVTKALNDAQMLLGDRRVTHILVDTDGVTGYDLDVRSPSIEFLQFFKGRGLQEIVAVMPNSLVSMFASTMRLITKVRFVIYKTRLEAVRYLAERQGEAAVK